MKKHALVIIAAALLCAASALAAPEKSYDGHFGDIDKNKDSYVVWEEFKAFFPHAEQAKFAEADTDKNGKIDHNEWHTFKDKHGYRHDPNKKD